MQYRPLLTVSGHAVTVILACKLSCGCLEDKFTMLSPGPAQCTEEITTPDMEAEWPK